MLAGILTVSLLFSGQTWSQSAECALVEQVSGECFLVVDEQESNEAPESQDEFPIIPETIDESSLDEVDALLKKYAPGLNYDYKRGKWWFEGVVVARVRYDMGVSRVDLIRVRYRMPDGQKTSVWVMAGAHIHNKHYFWNTQNSASSLVLGRTAVRVEIGEENGVIVKEDGSLDFSQCSTAICQIAAWVECTTLGFSRWFIASDGSVAPGWYPWGFLPWSVTMLNVNQAEIPVSTLN